MRFTLKYILIFGLSALSLHGVERQFCVLAPYGSQGLKDLGYLNGDSEFQKLKWGQQRRSPLFVAPGNAALTLVKPVLNEEGKTLYQPVVNLPWPGDSDLALFVVVVIEGKDTPLVFGLDDRFDTFPKNTLKVLNGLNQTIYALAGERKFQLSPSGSSKAFSTEAYQVIDKVLEEDEEAVPNPGMPIAVGVEANGVYDLIYAAGISISPDSRVLCLVLPPKKEGSTRYQARIVLD